MFSSQVLKNIMSLTSLTLLGNIYFNEVQIQIGEIIWLPLCTIQSFQFKISKESTHDTK